MYEYFYGVYESDDPEDTLEHHGILGMKWGVRRFQNYDGTLKAAGKKRRAEERVQKREARKTAKAEKKAAKEEEARKKIRAEIDDAIANVDFEKLSKYKGQMSDEDLKRIADRATNLGRTSTQLENYKKSLPPSTFDKVVKGLGAVKTVADAVKGAHESYSNLRKEFGLDTKSVIESVLKDKSDSGSKSDDDGPDIFDRVKDLTSKIKEERAAKKEQQAEQRKTNSDYIRKLQGINGKEKNDDDFRVNLEAASDWKRHREADSMVNKIVSEANVVNDHPSKESNQSFINRLKSVGDVTTKERTYKTASATPAPAPSAKASTTPVSSAKSPNGSKTVRRILKKSSASDTSIEDLTADLLERNKSKLGL